MRGQITTADIYLERKLRGAWVDEAIARDVVVTIRSNGDLADPESVLFRSVRTFYGKTKAKTKEVKDKVRRIKKFEIIDGLNLGLTQHDV